MKSEHTCTYQRYLADTGTFVKESALESKARKDSAQDSDDRLFYGGEAHAWYCIISLLQEQAEAFGIPFSALQLDDINPDRDLL